MQRWPEFDNFDQALDGRPVKQLPLQLQMHWNVYLQVGCVDVKLMGGTDALLCFCFVSPQWMQ